MFPTIMSGAAASLRGRNVTAPLTTWTGQWDPSDQLIVLFARSGSNNKGAVLWKYTQMEVMTVCVI